MIFEELAKRSLHNAKAVSAASSQQVRIVHAAQNTAAEVTGTDTEYFIARDWDVPLGREFTDSEVRGGAPVCVIGETIRSLFFGAGDPTGQSIRVGKVSCKVIGVLESKGFSGFGQDQDNVVMMPLSAFQRRKLLGFDNPASLAQEHCRRHRPGQQMKDLAVRRAEVGRQHQVAQPAEGSGAKAYTLMEERFKDEIVENGNNEQGNAERGRARGGTAGCEQG